MPIHSLPKIRSFFEKSGFVFSENEKYYFFSKMIDALYLKKDNFLLKLSIAKNKTFDIELFDTLKRLANYRNQIFGIKFGRLSVDDFINSILIQIENMP